MKKLVNILFGKWGWYTLLYLVSYIWYFIFPFGFINLGYSIEYWEIARGGGNWGGGFGQILPLITIPTIIPVLMIGSILWVITLKDSLKIKIFKVIGISIVAPIIISLVGMRMSSEFDFFFYYLGYLGLFGLHLYMLNKFINRNNTNNNDQSNNQVDTNTLQSSMSSVQPISTLIKPRKNIWKIISITLISIILFTALVVWFGYYISKPESDLFINQNNTLNMNKNYKDFAFDDNSFSLSLENPKNIESSKNGLGFPPKVIEEGDGFVVVYADSAQTTLKIPFGWYGLDNGKSTLFYDPSADVSLSLSFVNGGGDDFPNLKKFVAEEYNEYKEKGAITEYKDLPDGSFLNKVVGVNIDGEELSMVSVYTPDPNGGPYCMKILMSAPPQEFEKYYDLIELILTDREIKW